MSVMASKRKRESHDMPQARAAPGMHVDNHDFDQQYFHTDTHALDPNMDFSLAAVLQQHNAADQSGAVEVDVVVEDEEQDEADSAELQQHARQQVLQQVQPIDGAGSSASDTAAAALVQYHTMTVPQPTEHTFMQNHPAEIEGQPQVSTLVDPTSAQQRTTSFVDFDTVTIKVAPDAQNDEVSPITGDPLNPNAAKPAVGTDEWHKVRKDNHKEGESGNASCTQTSNVRRSTNRSYSGASTSRNDQRRH